jgi:hypothetical protein
MALLDRMGPLEIKPTDDGDPRQPQKQLIAESMILAAFRQPQLSRGHRGP